MATQQSHRGVVTPAAAAPGRDDEENRRNRRAAFIFTRNMAAAALLVTVAIGIALIAASASGGGATSPPAQAVSTRIDASMSPTGTASASPMSSGTPTVSGSVTSAASQTPTVTQSATASVTQSATASVTQSATSSATQSATASVTQSATASVTQSATSSVTQSATASVTRSVTSSVTQSATSTITQSATASSSSSSTPTASLTASRTSSASGTPAPLPVTTLAGSGSTGNTNGFGRAASFNTPYGICAVGSGSLFVADFNNHQIRQVVIGSTAVTTFAGGAASGSADGVGTQASFNSPAGITFDGLTTLYVAEFNNYIIRRISISSATVSTLAGSAGLSGAVNGVGTAARFANPSGITFASGNLYVAEQSGGLIRQIVVATATVSTLAGGGGGVDGTGTSASFNEPRDIFFSSGSLYVADTASHVIRQIIVSTGVVTTIAGSSSGFGSTDGVGTNSRFFYPYGVTADDAGNLYVADSINSRIRKIELSTATVTTVTGTSGAGYADGAYTNAKLTTPYGIAVVAGKLYVADTGNNRIRAIALSAVG